jgi:hypothetical protein
MLTWIDCYEVSNTLDEMIKNGDITCIAEGTYVTQETGYRKKFNRNEIVEYVWKLMQE